MIVGQRLMRLLCQHCRQPVEVEAQKLIQFGVPEKYLTGKTSVTLYRAVGCSYCTDTGYKGRAGAYEVMPVNEEIKGMVLERKPAHLIKAAARRYVMVTLREAAMQKLLSGKTTVEEVLRVTARDDD